MADESSNGPVVQMLQGIWNEMKLVNARIDRVRDDLRTEVGGEIARLAARVETGFNRVDQRFDQLLLGEHGREHREFRDRLGRVEAIVGLPKP